MVVCRKMRFNTPHIVVTYSYGLASWHCSSSPPHQESAGAFKEEGEILAAYSDFYHLCLSVMLKANI